MIMSYPYSQLSVGNIFVNKKFDILYRTGDISFNLLNTLHVMAERPVFEAFSDGCLIMQEDVQGVSGYRARLQQLTALPHSFLAVDCLHVLFNGWIWIVLLVLIFQSRKRTVYFIHHFERYKLIIIITKETIITF